MKILFILSTLFFQNIITQYCQNRSDFDIWMYERYGKDYRENSEEFFQNLPDVYTIEQIQLTFYKFEMNSQSPLLNQLFKLSNIELSKKYKFTRYKTCYEYDENTIFLVFEINKGNEFNSSESKQILKTLQPEERYRIYSVLFQTLDKIMDYKILSDFELNQISLSLEKQIYNPIIQLGKFKFDYLFSDNSQQKNLYLQKILMKIMNLEYEITGIEMGNEELEQQFLQQNLEKYLSRKSKFQSSIQSNEIFRSLFDSIFNQKKEISGRNISKIFESLKNEEKKSIAVILM